MIGARPAPLLPQSKFFTPAACTFSTTCVFACVCTFRLAVVIRVRPAPSFDQYGLLASTACTFLRRLMFILFWYLLKPARLCGGRPLLGRLGCLLEAPGPPREARPPEALQGGGLGRLGLSLGSLRTSFGRLPGPQRHPKVAPGTGPAGDISHQPPTPKPNAHTANPFATSRSGLRYRWKPHIQGIVMTIPGRNIGSRPITPGCKGTVAAEAKPV